MTILPVIERELRAQSRNRFTYYSRVTIVGALLCVAAFFLANNPSSARSGGDLFSSLNLAIFVTIWLLVPLLTADCLSRERREGTLGLLFLSALKPGEIVLAKGMVHGLRAFSLLLAIIPALAIPLMMGGVGWTMVLLSVLFNFSAICWALSAGMLASCVSIKWIDAQLCAWAFAAAALVSLCLVVGTLLLVVFWVGRAFFPDAEMLPEILDYEPIFRHPFFLFSVIEGGCYSATGFDGGWQFISRARWIPHPEASLVVLACTTAFVSLVFLRSSINFAAWRIRRAGTESGISLQVAWWQKLYCQPALTADFHRRSLRRLRERNPIGWLAHRNLSFRSALWMLVSFSFLVDSFAIGLQETSGLKAIVTSQAILLLGLMAANSAGSFQLERENGVMELLLVSPLTTREIVFSRLHALWGRFLLPALPLALLWSLSSDRGGDSLSFILILILAFVCIPIIGLYSSLRFANYLASLIFTVMATVAPPLILAQCYYSAFGLLDGFEFVIACYGLTLIILLKHGLNTLLRDRKFLFDRPA